MGNRDFSARPGHGFARNGRLRWARVIRLDATAIAVRLAARGARPEQGSDKCSPDYASGGGVGGASARDAADSETCGHSANPKNAGEGSSETIDATILISCVFFAEGVFGALSSATPLETSLHIEQGWSPSKVVFTADTMEPLCAREMSIPVHAPACMTNQCDPLK